MQFKKQMADLVLAGKKTQTRRLSMPRHKVGSIQPVQCGYRDKAQGHIRIKRVWRERIWRITEHEARLEGFRSRDEFMEYFKGINKDKKVVDCDVTVYEFEVEEESNETIT